jgi:hypothetical protein
VRFAQKAFVAVDVLGHHLEQVVRFAGHGVALQHFGIPHHGALEFVEVAAPVSGQLDVDEHRHVQPELLGVEEGDLALDQPVFLHAVDAPPARRLRQLDLLGDLRRGEVGVVLQQQQNLAVDAAQRGLHGCACLVVVSGWIMHANARTPQK